MENDNQNPPAQEAPLQPIHSKKWYLVTLGVSIVILIILWLLVWFNFNIGVNKKFLLQRADSAYFTAFKNKQCQQAYNMLTTNAQQQANFNKFKSVCNGEIPNQPTLISEKITGIKFLNNTYATVSSEITFKDPSGTRTGGQEQVNQTNPVPFNWIMEGSNWRLDYNMGTSGVDKAEQQKQADVAQQDQQVRSEYDQQQIQALKDGTTYNGQYFSIKFGSTWKNSTEWGGDVQYAPDAYFYTNSPDIDLPALDRNGNVNPKGFGSNMVYRFTVTVLPPDRFVKGFPPREQPTLTPELTQKLATATGSGDINTLYNLYFSKYVSGSDPFQNPPQHFELFTLNGKQGIIGSDYTFGIFGKAIFLTQGKAVEIDFEDTLSHDDKLNIPNNFWVGIKDRLMGQVLQNFVIK